MLVCQCNVISDSQIRAVVESLLADDPWAIVVPAQVYRALGKRYKCAGCVPNVVDIIVAVTEEYRRTRPQDDRPPPARPRRAFPRRASKGATHERRFEGHRTAE